MLLIINKKTGNPGGLAVSDEEILANLFPFGRVSPFAIILPTKHDLIREKARQDYLCEPAESKRKALLMRRLLCLSHTIPEFNDACGIATGIEESLAAISFRDFQLALLEDARINYYNSGVDYEKERLMAKMVVLRPTATVIN